MKVLCAVFLLTGMSWCGALYRRMQGLHEEVHGLFKELTFRQWPLQVRVQSIPQMSDGQVSGADNRVGKCHRAYHCTIGVL